MTHPDIVLAGLLPDVASKCRAHIARCASMGIPLLLYSGLRSAQEQLAEFTKGRAFNATTGIWSVVDHKRVTTNGDSEHTPHCRGAAYDLVPIVNEKAAWDRLDLFLKVGEVGEAIGLVWGGRWPKLKDMPHFELPNWRDLPLKVS